MSDDWRKSYEDKSKRDDTAAASEECAGECGSCAGAEGHAPHGRDDTAWANEECSGDCGSCSSAGEHAAPPADEEDCPGDCETCPMADQHNEQEREQRLQQKRIEDAASNIRHQILVISGKGGVGKSTVAANLAWGLAVRDERVGLMDADLHGPTIPIMVGLSGQRAQGNGEAIVPVPVFQNLSVMSMGFLTREQDDPVIWRGPIRANVLRQFIADVEWGPLDYLVIDLPPGTGDEPLTVAQSFPKADGAIIVTTPQEVSTADCRKAANFVKAVGLPILGVVENMSGFVCPHCSQRTDIFSSGGGETMSEQLAVPLLGKVPLAAGVAQLGDEGKPLLGPEAPEAVREAYEEIVQNLLARVGA